MRFPPDLVELEDHSTGYGGKGSLSTVCWPDGSVSAVSQHEQGVLVALLLARLGES